MFHTESNFSSFLKKKAKTILLPYFVLGIPMIPFAVMDAMKEGYYTKDINMICKVGSVIKKGIISEKRAECGIRPQRRRKKTTKTTNHK